jgi:deoxyribodipyrimidine photo-lyase
VAEGQLVWFKRDLRVHDHAPLRRAAAAGPVRCVYVHEPSARASFDWDPRHGTFVRESLDELARALQARGGALLELEGELPEVFDRLWAAAPFAALWSHAETGTWASWQRDRRVKGWCRRRGVAWVELAPAGVRRPHPRREGWAAAWTATMGRPVVAPPERVVADLRPAPPAAAPAEAPRGPERQAGGRSAGEAVLDDFLGRRGVAYAGGMSSPVSGWTACSRLSAHLAWGTLSAREVHQAALARARVEPPGSAWARSLGAFQSRLRWRCHFTQKLEDQPEIEHSEVCAPLAGLRPLPVDPHALRAWAEGRTGHPMVDACMRSLQATGWLPFRMRAMLLSYGAHDLWLDWRALGAVLARAFVDFDPGIHWPQAQMQAGVTGINAIRIYDPVKQALDHDPTGAFVRRWVPELDGVPLAALAQPWTLTASQQRRAGLRLGVDYPLPLVHHAAAARAAVEAIEARRRSPEGAAAAAEVLRRHGSRARWGRAAPGPQLGLPFGR